ncbi:MAG: hypothetical protein DRH15_12150 [Deltaproteobacteria bacterium]|nr:MAG: hypothetical protein DRH15_12150 [Deltaproteobacteria bacterium]
MIKVDISVVLTFYLAFTLISILFLWLNTEYVNKGKSKRIETERYFWVCSICTYTYVDSKHKDISICPRCGSYNKKEEAR